MVDVFEKGMEATKRIAELLQLVMALKDAYNDISSKHNAGKPVRKRATQLHQNLHAVLTADREMAAVDHADEEAFSNLASDPDQLTLPIQAKSD